MADRQNAWDIVGHDPMKIGRHVFGFSSRGWTTRPESLRKRRALVQPGATSNNPAAPMPPPTHIVTTT